MSSVSADVFQLWISLSASPLLWLVATLAAYLIGMSCHALSGRSPWVNPVGVGMAVLITLLLVTGTPYATFFAGAQFVHFLLGPATVALAVPLYHNWERVRQSLLPMAAAVLAGSLTAIGSAVGIAWAFGGSHESLLSLAPKSITSPIAMGVAEKIGGIPSLTAALVILTGVLGAVLGSPVLRLLNIRDPMIQGYALGTASHGIGTARAFQISPLAGTFSGIAMGLNGLLTAVLIPLLNGLLNLK